MDNLIYVSLDSTELQLFYKKIHTDVSDLIRNYVCTKCWGLIKLEHRKYHQKHRPDLIQAITVSSPELFIETAKKYGMTDGIQVALLKDYKDMMREIDQVCNSRS